MALERLQNAIAVLSTKEPTRLQQMISNESQTAIARVPRGGWYLVTSNYEVAHQITMDSNFERATIQKKAKEFAGDTLTQDGSDWKDMRRRINPSFTRETIPQYLDDILTITGNEVKAWVKENPKGEFALKERMQELVGKIATATLLGGREDMEELAPDIAWIAMNGILFEAIPGIKHLPIGKPKEYKERIKKVHAKLGQLIDNSTEENYGLLSVFAKEFKDGNLTRKAAILEIQGVFVAAFETTATVSTWALAELSRHPEFYEKLRQEALNFHSLTPNSYALQCFNEAARLYPPAWRQLRQPVKDATLSVKGKDIVLPAGTLVVSLTHLLHRNKSIWGQDAEEFNPNHTTAENLDRLKKEYPGAYVPWNGGRHLCPGMLLSQIEGSIILAKFAQSFTYEELKNMVSEFPKPLFATALSPDMR